ncbi:hypothetical protein G6O67_003951 [Ophiocordyceps sinensis]|uniref:Signal recognition particle subunit SRP72 n=1 Tax=Ophiocordyceps sinensis TaxID=72228 RepID=A0A8H4PST8_9HYPO|nr:hypothetical protein G6O67_003951 [Ophiocordyceps sinensis]
MPQDPAAQLSALLRATTIDDHDEILNAANAALKANKRDELAQHTRVVALLKLDRFNDAIRVLYEGDAKLQARCPLEKAYALYKTGKLDEAASALDSECQYNRSSSHVAAQVAYRAERFSEAEAIYKRLIDTDAAHETNDIGINIKAAQAQSGWQGRSSVSASSSGDTPEIFELCYNAACAHIAQASLSTAVDLLHCAVKLCDASNDLTEEDKAAELKPILAQQAYVYARLGDARNATDLHRSLDVSSDTDPELAVLARNNKSASENQPANPFLYQRQVTAWMSDARKANLFTHQSNALTRNALLVDLQAHKADGVRDRTRNILDKERHPTTNLDANATSVIHAAAQTKGLNSRETLRAVVTISKQRPNSVGLVVTVVQLYAQQKSLGAALSVLESFLGRLEISAEDQDQDVRYSPGLVALAVSLMRAVRRESSAKAELVKAAAYWRDRPVSSAESLLREAGIKLARSSNPADLSLAVAAFNKLHDENQRSPIISAGLVAALAASNPSQVEQHIAELPSIESLIKGIDVGALNRAGVATAPANASAAIKRPAPDRAMDDKAANKSRKRRRLPKNLVDGKAPDPERWLSLRDRSTYRPKGKRGKRRVAESTQGGVVKDEETLDLVGGGGVRVEKTLVAGASKMKKKKKGKK